MIASLTLGASACGRGGFEALKSDAEDALGASTADGPTASDGVAAEACAPADEAACAEVEREAGSVSTVDRGIDPTCGDGTGACAFDCPGDCHATCQDSRSCSLVCEDSSCQVACLATGTCCLRCGSACRVCSGGCLLTCP